MEENNHFPKDWSWRVVKRESYWVSGKNIGKMAVRRQKDQDKQVIAAGAAFPCHYHHFCINYKEQVYRYFFDETAILLYIILRLRFLQSKAQCEIGSERKEKEWWWRWCYSFKYGMRMYTYVSQSEQRRGWIAA